MNVRARIGGFQVALGDPRWEDFRREGSLFSWRPWLRQYCRAILTATSTETEPESLKKTVSRPSGVMSEERMSSPRLMSILISWYKKADPNRAGLSNLRNPSD